MEHGDRGYGRGCGCVDCLAGRNKANMARKARRAGKDGASPLASATVSEDVPALDIETVPRPVVAEPKEEIVWYLKPS